MKGKKIEIQSYERRNNKKNMTDGENKILRDIFWAFIFENLDEIIS